MLRVVTCLLLAVCPLAAHADICGAPDGLVQGNAYSDREFATHAIEPFDARRVAVEPDFYILEPSGGDDTGRLQAALDRHGRVMLREGQVYSITRQLRLGDGVHLAGEGAGATLFLRNSTAGGFDNKIQSRIAVFDGRGEGMRITGKNITLDNLFIVKEYEDDTYVVGITVRGASGVTLNQLRMRGFALAPGIISVHSGSGVSITNSIIHASCSRSKNPPSRENGGDMGAFQITAIGIDDNRPNGSSQRVIIRNNVIRDLGIEESGNSRGDQSDGINISHSRYAPEPGLIEANHIANVAEAIDLFGRNIVVRDNILSGTQLSIKLIHGARGIEITGNQINGAPRYGAIGAFTANTESGAERQVRDIAITRNEFDLRGSDKYAIVIDSREGFVPENITIRRNRFRLPACNHPAILCETGQCDRGGNKKFDAQNRPC